MPLRLLPWSPEYGSALQADPDSYDEPDATAAETFEGEWRARRPSGDPPAAVQIVDGVRRVEAHALDDLPDGETAFGLFGSYAVGAVRCEGDRSWVLDGEGDGEGLRVRRSYLQAGGEPRDREIAAGSARLRFRASTPPTARTPNDLVAALNRLMLDEEARLAETLSADESALTLVDGPLRLRAPGPRVAGYVKRTYRWYLEPRQRALLPDLAVGERTPLFRICGGGEEGDRGGRDRTAWYMRLADLGPHVHPLAGVVEINQDVDVFRFEVPSSDGYLTIRTTGQNATHGILHFPDGSSLLSGYSGVGDNFQIVTGLVASGTYFVEVFQLVRSPDPPFPLQTVEAREYALEVAFNRVPPDQHGDRHGTATRVGPNSSTRGVLQNAEDRDFFRFEVPSSGGYLTIETTGTADTVGTLYLRDGTVRSNDDGGDGFNFRIVTGLVPGGTYVVEVSAFVLDAFPIGEFRIGEYVLHVSVDVVRAGAD